MAEEDDKNEALNLSVKLILNREEIKALKIKAITEDTKLNVFVSNIIKNFLKK